MSACALRLSAWLILLPLSLLACGPAARATYNPAERTAGLETELARIPSSTEPGSTAQRSRLLRALGKQDQALEELAASADAARERLSWGDLAMLWREIGTIHMEMGQPEKALDVFGKRLKAAASLDEPKERAFALVDTAWAFALLGYLGQADEAVTEAHYLGGDALKADPIALERLGIIADLLDDGGEARKLLSSAAEGHRTRGDAVSAARAEVLAARIASRDGGDVSALSHLEGSAGSLLDAEPLALLRRFQAEADLLGLDHDTCERRANEAWALADARGLQPVAKIGRLLAARCADKLGRTGDAIAVAREAGSILEMELRNVTGDTARQHLSFEAFLLYRMLLSLEAKHPSKDRVTRAFATSERARARSHLDALARTQLGAFAGTLPLPEALAQNREDAKERVKQLTQALMQSRSARDEKRHRDALWALEDIEEAIARANPLLSRIAAPDPATIDRVKKELLDDDSLLLSYFMTQEQVLVFAIDRSGESLDALSATPQDVDAAVEQYRRRVLLVAGASKSEVVEAGQKLYRLLLGPVDARLENKKRLIIVPHGKLSFLPFESLVDGDGKYLVERHDVVYSVSATVGLALEKQGASSAQRRAFVGMGDPVYDWAAFEAGKPEGTALASTRALALWTMADEQVGSGGGGGLERLPGTATELRAIAKLFGGDQKLYLRAQASEEQVKDGALSGARIVHIASHGLAAPRYSALALSIKPGAREDGFLMNSEIAALKLDADLLVLSACRTGFTAKQLAGEPVVGMTLSLRSAGARQVVLSMWSVDDDATADLMTKFYTPLVAPAADYAASLAAAKRKMIADGKWGHPYFWAAFVLHGS